MSISSFLIRVLFVFGLICLAAANIGPALIKSSDVTDDKVDLTFKVPVLNKIISLKSIDVSKKNQTILTWVGGIALTLSILWAIININPVRIISSIQNKHQIKGELNKMNKVLKEIEKI